MPQSRAAISKTRTRAQQIAIATLALLLIALLGFYTLVTGRITDGSAKLRDGAAQASAGAGQLDDGAGKLANGASLADTGAGKLSAGAEKISSGISTKLAPGADKLQAGAGKLAEGAVRIEADVTSKLAPGVYKVDDGAQKLAAGAVQLSAALTPTPAGNAENNLADGATRLDGGAAQLAGGTAALAGGTDQLKGYRGANGNPEAGTGTAALAQALELLEAAADDPVKGLVPLSVVKDKIAKITAGAHKLDAGASQLQAGAQRLQDGAGQLNAGTGKLKAGFATLAGKLNSQDPGSPGVVLGTRLLADGTSKIRVGMDGVPGDPEHPGLLKAAARMTEGSSRLADGTVALNAGIKGNPADPANPGLLGGSRPWPPGPQNSRPAAPSWRPAPRSWPRGRTSSRTATPGLPMAPARCIPELPRCRPPACSGSPTPPRHWDSSQCWPLAPLAPSWRCGRGRPDHGSFRCRLHRRLPGPVAAPVTAVAAPAGPAGSRPRGPGSPGPVPRRGSARRRGGRPPSNLPHRAAGCPRRTAFGRDPYRSAGHPRGRSPGPALRRQRCRCQPERLIRSSPAASSFTRW